MLFLLLKKGDLFMPAAEPIRNKTKLRQLANYYLLRGQHRNYALVIVGVHTALRISDLLLLTWDHVFDERSGDFRTHIVITEKKTKKEKTVRINHKAVKALRLLYPNRRGKYIFVNNRKDEKPISRVQAWRIIKTGTAAVGIAGLGVSCHSLRKSFGYHAWKAGVLPVMLMDLYNHSSFEITRRYLGISQDERDKVYLQMRLF